MTREVDIAIVGGGLAGASLACALRHTPLSVAVLEAVPFSSSSQPSYDDRAIALAWASRRIFEGIGAWQGMAPEACAIERIHISHRGRFGAVRLDRDLLGADALGYVVETRAIGRVLLELLEQAANVELLCPVRPERLAAGPRHAHLGWNAEDGAGELNARLVVLADGGRSGLRESAGLVANARRYGQTAVTTNVTTELPHHHSAWERFTPSGPLALLPMNGNRSSLVWTMPDEQAPGMLALEEADFLARLAQRFGDRVGSFLKCGTRNAYPLSITTIEKPVSDRVVLVGNSAHTLHPVAGQGFNLGLRDVAQLAELLHEAALAGRDPGAPGLLAQYAAMRGPDTRRMERFTDGLVRIFSSDFFPLACARGLGLVAVDLLPPLKRGLVRMTMGLAGRRSRLALGLPLQETP